MNKALNELKIQARLLQKRVHQPTEKKTVMADNKLSEEGDQRSRYKDCLLSVAQSRGFKSWQHANQVLSGKTGEQNRVKNDGKDPGLSGPGADMGKLWYDKRCMALLNIWETNYQQARMLLTEKRGQGSQQRCLLPYGTQFIVVDWPFIDALGFTGESRPLWQATSYDLVAGYGTCAWDELAMIRLKTLASRDQEVRQ